MIEFRTYDSERDRKATHRIWREVGWLKEGKEQEEAMDLFVQSGRALVAEVRGEAESLAMSLPGTLRYLDEELPFTGVSGVTTSRVARKQGLAGRLTAQLIAQEVAAGALVAGLGMFEQGFYNRLGFGTGPYEHWLGFDPAQLRLDVRSRIPHRITSEDWAEVHACRLTRHRGHGAINLEPAESTRAEMLLTENGFGLGYYDGPDGELTHHLWFNGGDKEHGPYNVWWYAYQTLDQFLELMALLRTLGDQIRLVRMREPRDIQFQDLLKQPFRHRQLTEKSKFESRANATAYWQARICDLSACLAKTHLRCETVRFNLQLTDPIEDFFDHDAPWSGIGGEYIVTLGPESAAERGSDPALPVLKTSVNAFTRLWMGARPATGLAVTTELSGPPELMAKLDQLLCLPEPRLDWDF